MSVPETILVASHNAGKIVEVQGTAEGTPFSREEFSALLDLAETGIGRLVDLQKMTVE